MDARHAVEGVARTSYGRLVALLASRSRDIAGAEDALAEAFRAALETWPRRGVPERPEAWLLTAARRALGHAHRHDQVRQSAGPALDLLREEMDGAAAEPIGDARLELLFVCAHPAIDASMRTPLMLQTVLGVDAARIAAAFLVAPAAMGQRLARAKARIRDAGIRFEKPEPEQLAERLDSVLSAIYAAYGTAWNAAPNTSGDLAAEAIFLARLVTQLLPNEPEARGLLSLTLYCEARARARRSAAGAFVPLDAQDASLWSRPLIIEAEHHLTLASRSGAFGRFQTEAAIQSVHAQRAFTGRTDHLALVALYDLLVARTPSVGALVARAAAHGEALGADAGLTALEQLDPAITLRYQPYWAGRAHLLRRAGRIAEALAAYESALSLTSDPVVQAYLRSQALQTAAEIS